MQIVGIGTEIVECVRIGRMIQEHGEHFLERAFTAKELRHCQKRKQATEHFAAQWAAKEAILKALGIHAAKGIDWTDLEIVCKTGRKPIVQLHGAIKELVGKRRIAQVLVTMAHCRAYGTAFAIAMKE